MSNYAQSMIQTLSKESFADITINR
jgi:hypothetical protein